MRWWKVVGLAGLAGVAATGVAVARSERRRRAYTPDEIRARLHSRIDDAASRESTADDATPGLGLSRNVVAPSPHAETGRVAAVRTAAVERGRTAFRAVAGRVRTLRDRAGGSHRAP
ncbi:hypothetical protein [Cryptosporangium aurantiacum]|uniref:Uncharacterized protein n=1 Tax=Cryptosporangium aurantiacum TaxID=134849 RepID=A0A1M7JFD8_9ACTN|nr:hypothetical protein [Cryptosporangium aurantiacum]SHM51678.1 hypothetical protein SAMN05443668_101778 [Cryptosporangium aurantiacum]